MIDWVQFFSPGSHVLALPGWQQPRLYLPAGRFDERWRASSFYPASRFRARIYRLMLRAKATSGLAGVRTARSDKWLLGEFTQEILPQAVSAGVLVGTPGPAQKITVQLRDEKGRIVGYLKYAEKRAARERLRKEHLMLSAIPAGLGPEALKYGVLGDGNALLTTPILGSRLPAILPPAEGVASFSMTFAVSSPVPVEAHPWVCETRNGQGGRHLDACFEALAGRRWPVVAQHGDFAPWNLIRTSEGAIRAFDWEYGTMKGFPYLDLIFYLLQTSALMYRWSPARAMAYTIKFLTGSPRLGLSGTQVGALTRLAAFDAYHKALVDGHMPDTGLQPWRREIWEGAACSV